MRAIEAVSLAPHDAFEAVFEEDCGVDVGWCAVNTVQPDARAAEAARQALQAALRNERQSLQVRLYSARDQAGALRLRFFVHGPRSDQKDGRIDVKGNSPEFVERVVRAARRKLPRYLGTRLEVWCEKEACGIYVVEQAQSHLFKVAEAVDEVCVPLQCQVQLKRDPRARHNRERGSIHIARHLDLGRG